MIKILVSLVFPFLTMILLIAYAFLTGGVRATIMETGFLASFIMERESESINTLNLAGLILLLMNPLNLFDVGFQLSFMSVWAIISFYPVFMHGLSRWSLKSKPKIVRYLVQSVAVSSAAFLGVAGIFFFVQMPGAYFPLE